MTSAHLHIELRDAVAVVRLTRPLKRNALNDGLIADLRMPDIDGFEMLRQLSAHPQFSNVAVIAITGLTPEEIEEHGELPEGTHVMHKPADMGWLRGYLQAMLSMRASQKRQAPAIDMA